VSETNTSHFTATNPKIEASNTNKNHRDLGSAVIQHTIIYIEEATTKVSWKPPANSPSTERPVIHARILSCVSKLRAAQRMMAKLLHPMLTLSNPQKATTN